MASIKARFGMAIVAVLCLMAAMPAQATSARLPGSVDDYTATETPYGVRFVLKANPLQVRQPPPEVDRFYFDDDFYRLADGRLVPNAPCPVAPPKIATQTVTVRPDLSALNAALAQVAAGYAIEASGFDRMARGERDAGLAIVARGVQRVAAGMKALTAAKADLER